MLEIADGMSSSCGAVKTEMQDIIGLGKEVYIIIDPVAQDTMGGAFRVDSDGTEQLYVSEVYWTAGYSPTEFDTYMYELLRHEGAHAADWVENWRPDNHGWLTSDYHGTSHFAYMENCENN